MAVTSLIKSVEDTKSIGELYSAVKKAQQNSVVSDIQNHSIFSSSKGGSYQKVLDGILDKIVATGGIKQDSRSVKQGIDEIVEEVNKISPKNKVSKDIKTLMSMKFDPEKEGILVSGLIKKTLMANVKKYNSSDRALAENIINNIDRVDLGTTKIAKVEDKRKAPPPRRSSSVGMI